MLRAGILVVLILAAAAGALMLRGEAQREAWIDASREREERELLALQSQKRLEKERKAEVERQAKDLFAYGPPPNGCGGEYDRRELAVGLPEIFIQCSVIYRAFGHVNTTVTESGTSRQYVYHPVYPVKYIYTRNGVITGFQK